MQKRKEWNRLMGVQALAAAVCALELTAGSAHAVVIDVGLANVSPALTTTTTNSTNGGINPVTYTPAQVTIPDAPGVLYDAADTNDTSGTIWNSIQPVGTAPTTSVSSVLYEQDLALVSSTGAATTAELNVSALEGPGKLDFIHSTSNVPTTAGTDGLLPNPANSTYLVGSTPTNGNGYTASNVQRLLMGNEWVANSASDGFNFQITGLTAYEGDSFSMYVYGSGTANGQGGVFTLAAANGGASASTNSSSTNKYYSVFDSTGINPLPEQGLSWNLITGVVDSNGNVSLTETDNTDAVKPGADGFQLDISVPEPTSLGLITVAGLGLLARRRRNSL